MQTTDKLKQLNELKEGYTSMTFFANYGIIQLVINNNVIKLKTTAYFVSQGW